MVTETGPSSGSFRMDESLVACEFESNSLRQRVSGFEAFSGEVRKLRVCGGDTDNAAQVNNPEGTATAVAD
jgi:hypothetical protein